MCPKLLCRFSHRFLNRKLKLHANNPTPTQAEAIEAASTNTSGSIAVIIRIMQTKFNYRSY